MCVRNLKAAPCVVDTMPFLYRIDVTYDERGSTSRRVDSTDRRNVDQNGRRPINIRIRVRRVNDQRVSRRTYVLNVPRTRTAGLRNVHARRQLA